MSNADLRAAAETLRRQARLARGQGGLVKLQGDLSGCRCCQQTAASFDTLAGMCEAAAGHLLSAIDLYERAHLRVTGLPPQPKGPTLKVVDDDDTHPPPAA